MSGPDNSVSIGDRSATGPGELVKVRGWGADLLYGYPIGITAVCLQFFWVLPIETPASLSSSPGIFIAAAGGLMVGALCTAFALLRRGRDRTVTGVPIQGELECLAEVSGGLFIDNK